MRATSLLRRLLCQKHTKVTGFEFTDLGLIVDVAPTTRLLGVGERTRDAAPRPRCRRPRLDSDHPKRIICLGLQVDRQARRRVARLLLRNPSAIGAVTESVLRR